MEGGASPQRMHRRESIINYTDEEADRVNSVNHITSTPPTGAQGVDHLPTTADLAELDAWKASLSTAPPPHTLQPTNTQPAQGARMSAAGATSAFQQELHDIAARERELKAASLPKKKPKAIPKMRRAMSAAATTGGGPPASAHQQQQQQQQAMRNSGAVRLEPMNSTTRTTHKAPPNAPQEQIY